MSTTWQAFNINQQVRVRFTDFGKEILRKEQENLQATYPHVNFSSLYVGYRDVGDGWFETTAWRLMQSFGPHISMGFKVPFNTTILLEVEDKDVQMAKKQTPVFGNKESVMARLTLVIEYEELPDKGDIEELVEKAREQGHPVKAELEILKASTVNVL